MRSSERLNRATPTEVLQAHHEKLVRYRGPGEGRANSESASAPGKLVTNHPSLLLKSGVAVAASQPETSQVGPRHKNRSVTINVWTLIQSLMVRGCQRRSYTGNAMRSAVCPLYHVDHVACHHRPGLCVPSLARVQHSKLGERLQYRLTACARSHDYFIADT